MNVLRVKLSNIGSFKDQEVIFGREPRLMMVMGINNEEGSTKESNGSGKSTFFVDAPEWILWGRIKGTWNKDIHTDEVLRVIDGEERVKEGYGEMDFELNGNIYRIKRSVKLGGSQTLSLFQKVNKEWQPLTKSADIDKITQKKISAIGNTQRKLDQILGCTADLGINSIFFEQGNMGAFAKASIKEREELLSIAVDVERWQNYGVRCKARVDNINEKISNLTYVVSEKTPEKIEEQIAELQTKIDEASKELKNEEANFKKVSKSVEAKRLEYMELEALKQTSNEIIAKKNKLVDKYKSVADSLASLDAELDSINESDKKAELAIDQLQTDMGCLFSDLTTLEDQVKEVDDKELEASRFDIEAATDKINEINTQLQLKKQERDRSKIITCPGTDIPCKNANNEAIEAKKKQIVKEIFSLERQLLQLKKDKETKQLAFALLKEVADNNKTIRQQIITIQNELQTKSNRIVTYAATLETCSATANRVRKESKRYKIEATEIKLDLESLSKEIEANRSKLEQVEKVSKELKDLEAKKAEIETEVEGLREECTSAKVELATREAEYEKVAKIKKELVELDEESNVLEFAHKMYSKAIPHALIEQAVPEIEMYSKQFIERLSRGRMDIDFVTNKQLRSKDADKNLKTKDTFEVVLTMDGRKYSYALFSGGEKSRADVAIHLAYSLYLLNRSGAKLESLFLDEVCGALDEEGRELLVEILYDLLGDGYFKKIFLITQDKSLRKKIDDVYTVVKTSEGSVINV